MRIAVSAEAERDLEDIADFIAQANPGGAVSFVMELDRKARRLCKFPQRLPLVPVLAHLEVRRRAYRNYLIFCRVEAERVLILRYLHAARDYEPLLGSDE